MDEWRKMQRELNFPEGTRFVIRNDQTGAYIHKSLFRIRTFSSYYAAAKFMRRNGLREEIYRVEAIR
ncbi:MAG: hypothetical protein IJ170_10065 [Ruminococcus sp.]|nr:hypothetical protein [Ruminococcus sp.]